MCTPLNGGCSHFDLPEHLLRGHRPMGQVQSHACLGEGDAHPKPDAVSHAPWPSPSKHPGSISPAEKAGTRGSSLLVAPHYSWLLTVSTPTSAGASVWCLGLAHQTSLSHVELWPQHGGVSGLQGEQLRQGLGKGKESSLWGFNFSEA